MDQKAHALSLEDSVLKLRSEMISQLARGKREKSKEFKPLHTRKQVEEYRNKILTERQQMAKKQQQENFTDEDLNDEEKLLYDSLGTQEQKKDYLKQIAKTRPTKRFIMPEQTLKDDFMDETLIAQPIGLLTDAQKQQLRNDIEATAQEMSNGENQMKDYMLKITNLKEMIDRLDLSKRENQLKKRMYDTRINRYEQNINNIRALLANNQNQLNVDQRRLDADAETILGHYANIDAFRKRNNQRLQDFASMINNLNYGELDLKQQPTETDEQYFQRLKDVGDSTYDDDQLALYADMDIFDKLKENLLELFKDRALIDSVIKEIDVIDKGNRDLYNKSFPAIKEKFLKLYGFNNEKLQPREIAEALDNIYKSIFNPDPTALKIMRDVENVLTEVKTLKKEENTEVNVGVLQFDVAPDPRIKKTGPEVDSKVFIMINMIEDNISDREVLYLKVGWNENVWDVYYSLGRADTTDIDKIIYDIPKIGSYNRVFWENNNINEHTWTEILENKFGFAKNIYKLNMKEYDKYFYYMNDDKSKEKLLKTLRQFGLNFDKDIPVIKLVGKSNKSFKKSEYFKNNADFKTPTGMGITTKYDIPTEPVQYGNILLNLHKLYYKNIVSIKDLGNRQIQSFKSTPVSDEFVNYVIKGFYKEPVSETDYKQLKSSELELLDQLNYLAGFAKEKNIKKQKYVDELRQELDLLTGAIVAGNNNEKMLKDLRTILNKLVSFDAISLQSSKNYLNQFKPYFE